MSRQKWTSLFAQMVKNLPAMGETQVQPLGREDLLEKGLATHSSILAWRIPWTEETVDPHGVTMSWTRLTDFHFIFWVKQIALHNAGGSHPIS